MADRQLTIAAERWLDEVLLTQSTLNIDGETTDSLLPPAGLGDLAIMELVIEAGSIATLMTNPEIYGPRVHVAKPTPLTVVDFAGSARWQRTVAAGLYAYISPDPLVLWKQDEVLRVAFAELDTNASPTVDVSYYIKCVRVRPIAASSQPAPLRLVR